MEDNKMETITLSKEGTFDAAHRLCNYEGKCNNPHGHTWVWRVDISGKLGDGKSGFLVDFSIIKKTVEKFDHKTILNKKDPLVKALMKEGISTNSLVIMNCEPTCENLVSAILEDIQNLPFNGEVTWIRVMLAETETSFITKEWEK